MSFDRMKRARSRVKDILSAIEEIEGFLAGVGQQSFVENRMLLLAVTQLVEIIGEAAKHLAPGIDERQPQIPWRQVRSTRDRIVHEYGKIDSVVVWEIATSDLAPLRAAMLAERDWLDAQ
jgi:uncharacterized protein with HEPN domain